MDHTLYIITYRYGGNRMKFIDNSIVHNREKVNFLERINLSWVITVCLLYVGIWLLIWYSHIDISKAAL